MNWFEQSTEKIISSLKSSDFDQRLSRALDIKYGDYNYSLDAREHTKTEFETEFLKLIQQLKNRESTDAKALVCGANSGYELKYLNDYEITALDLSTSALTKLRKKYPNVDIRKSPIDKLPLEDNTFDLYIALRTIQSRYVDLFTALEESIRVTKKGGTIIVSIPNAYIINKNLEKGMYDVRSKLLDKELPYKLANQLKEFFDKRGFTTSTIEITSEIFVVAKD